MTYKKYIFISEYKDISHATNKNKHKSAIYTPTCLVATKTSFQLIQLNSVIFAYQNEPFALDVRLWLCAVRIMVKYEVMQITVNHGRCWHILLDNNYAVYVQRVFPSVIYSWKSGAA